MFIVSTGRLIQMEKSEGKCGTSVIKELMEAGIPSLAPWDTGGLIDTDSQDRSRFWHEKPGKFPQEAEGRKRYGQNSKFQISPLGKPN